MNSLITSVPVADAVAPIVPAEIALKSTDFHFVNHTNPERFFEGSRPYRVIHTKPTLATYSNVIYTPAFREGPKVRLGCLYDEELNRIDLSMTYRGRTDDRINTDPERYEGNPSDLPLYERPVLYMGHLRPHFGHFIMETLGNWWTMTEENIDVDRYLFHVLTPSLLERSYVKACLDAMEFNPDNMVWFDKPMRFKKVVVAQASFQLHSHIFTSYRTVLNKLTIALGADQATLTDQPVFLSRRFDTKGVRQYIGQEKVEDFLAKKGVRVIAPNQIPFSEQLRLANEHRTIIGFQGSQLVNIVGALGPRHVIYLTDRKAWSDRFLIDKCFDLESSYVNVCESDQGLGHYYRVAKKKLTGKKVFKDGFQKLHQVDVNKTIAWFKSTGLV